MARTDEDAFDWAQTINEMGLEKAMAILARFERNANREQELLLNKMRHLADVAAEQRKASDRAERTRIAGEREASTGAERTARRLQRDRITNEQARQRAEAAQYRQERDAQRQAYREQMDRERRERREAAAAPKAQWQGPTVSTGGKGLVPTGGGWAPDKSAVAKFIIFATALGALGTLINSTSGKSPTTVQQINGVTIPTHLRSLGGTFIAGTIALVVNEVYPGAGAVLGAGIVGLIVIPNWTPALARIGALSFTGLPVPKPKTGPAANQVPGASTNQQSENWIKSHPGVWPNPGKGASDFWNGVAKQWADHLHIPMQGKP